MKTPNSVIIYSTPKLTSAKHRDIIQKDSGKSGKSILWTEMVPMDSLLSGGQTGI